MKASLEINTTIDVLDQAQADHIAVAYATILILIPDRREDLEAILHAIPEDGLVALLPTSDVVIGEAEE